MLLEKDLTKGQMMESSQYTKIALLFFLGLSLAFSASAAETLTKLQCRATVCTHAACANDVQLMAKCQKDCPSNLVKNCLIGGWDSRFASIRKNYVAMARQLHTKEHKLFEKLIFRYEDGKSGPFIKEKSIAVKKDGKYKKFLDATKETVCAKKRLLQDKEFPLDQYKAAADRSFKRYKKEPSHLFNLQATKLDIKVGKTYIEVELN